MTTGLAPASSPAVPGSLVATTETSERLSWWRAAEYPAGLHVIVDEYVSAEESSDGHAFYWASDRGGESTVAIAAEHVQVLRDPGQMEATQVPKVAALKSFIRSELVGDGDGFGISGSREDNADDAVTFRGRTEGGLPFAVTVRVEPPVALAS